MSLYLIIMQIDHKSESRLQSFIKNPRKALWSIAVPIMFGMGIQTLYNIVDMIFIGRLGGEAITGVALNMPLFFWRTMLSDLCHSQGWPMIGNKALNEMLIWFKRGKSSLIPL